MPAAAAKNPHTALSDSDRGLLRQLAEDRVAFDEPMRRRTTLKIGGPADAWFAPGSPEELARVVRACRERDIPLTPVGGGSNVLIRDGGIRGVAVSTRNMRMVERVAPTVIKVQAGVSTGKLLSVATRWELGGVAFLAGVPGSVGGGLIMNAGTYLGEFKDVVREVTSIRLDDGQTQRRNAAECRFVYRGSALPANEIVLEAILELYPRARADIEKEVRELRERRRSREPKRVQNAGSVFKNPKGDYAGRLIEAAGLKGTRLGDAECSPVHANWFVNLGEATAADMLALIALVQREVERASGVVLELEWKILGED